MHIPAAPSVIRSFVSEAAPAVLRRRSPWLFSSASNLAMVAFAAASSESLSSPSERVLWVLEVKAVDDCKIGLGAEAGVDCTSFVSDDMYGGGDDSNWRVSQANASNV
jgi:hypothetical protein